ncbi:MAG: putative protein N(5)-glutamine methyltransferase [Microbacteriaceae bacterium]
MDDLLEPPGTTAIVARLRAAGCVFSEEEAALLLGATASPAELEGMIVRRVAGFPLEHILGWAEFDGARFAVTEGVFVPRRRSTLLVREAASAASRAQSHRPAAIPVVLDLCCGTGALGGAVRSRVPGIELWAADIDRAAVGCARTNLGLDDERVLTGDLFEPLPQKLRGGIDIILCNTPYVPSGELGMLPPEARHHEPRAALDGGVDGLDVQRRVAAEARFWLRPGGLLFVEAGRQQARVTSAIFDRAGLEPRIVEDAELDATVVIGREPL